MPSYKKNNTSHKRILSDFILLIVAIIWGNAFVFQKIAAAKIDGIHFNILRFFIAAIVMYSIHITSSFFKGEKIHSFFFIPQNHLSYLIGGTLLSIGINLQQIALLYSSAGKTGIITGLYVVLVPIIGTFIGKKNTVIQWISAFLSVIGLYAMSIHGTFYLEWGDILLILNAITWAIYILYISHASPQHNNTLLFAMWQYVYCVIFSILISTLLFFFTRKETSLIHILLSLPSLLYNGFFVTWKSVIYTSIFATCFGFSLQLYAQKNTPASHVALIISLEAVFAMIFGIITLNERPIPREIIGAIIICIAILFSQIYGEKNNKNT